MVHPKLPGRSPACPVAAGGGGRQPCATLSGALPVGRLAAADLKGEQALARLPLPEKITLQERGVSALPANYFTNASIRPAISCRSR
jgi:hypothetical protein